MIRDERVILGVEDDGDDAELIKTAFRRSGFENPIWRTAGVQQGLDYLSGTGQYTDRKKFPFPDLVLIDHKMPGDGWGIIEWVRKRPNLSWLPVIVFSGSDDPEHQQKAMDLGASAYHVKPGRFEEFSAALRRIGEFWLGGSSLRPPHRPRP